MSIFRLIKENMELSHINLAVIRESVSDYLFAKQLSTRQPIRNCLIIFSELAFLFL